MKLFILIVTFIFCNASFAVQSETQKIATFCKVWGFLKYYHPAVSSGKINWDEVFLSRLDDARSKNTFDETNGFYLDWISSMGNLKKNNTVQKNGSQRFTRNFDLSWLQDSSIFSRDVRVKLDLVRVNRNQGRNFYVQQSKIVGFAYFKNEKSYTDSVFPSENMRLLALSRFWNIANYFYPYKYLTDQNWDSVLFEMIPKFIATKDTVQYHMVVRELVAKLNDTHGEFHTNYTSKYFGIMWAPFNFKIIDDVAIVTGYLNDSLCLLNDMRVGDVIHEINGSSIADIIKVNSKYVPASNEAALNRSMYHILFNGSTDSVLIKYERSGKFSERNIGRYRKRDVELNWIYPEDTCKTWKIINDDIGYINLGRLVRNEIKEIRFAFQNTKSVILDVRNYPNGTLYKLSDWLKANSSPFFKFSKPDLTYPGNFVFSEIKSCGHTNRSPYHGQVIILVNEETQSHGEFTAMALKTIPNSIIVGSQTAGADGNVTQVVLPGNIRTYMSGLGIYYPDGSETQRVGIIPDITVKLTINGIRSGKDEIMEKAILIANEKR